MEELGDARPLGVFIRSILGLDEHAAKAAFGEFLSRADMRADQIRFIDQLISYLSINGIIDKSMLSGPPFTDLNDQGIFGLFNDSEQDKLLSIMDGVNGNAVA
jgi:type I restriction enzyme R subunit